MTSKRPDTQVLREIREFNREFLELVREHPGPGPAYGLETQVLQRLRAMPSPDLQVIADTPCLLVGFPATLSRPPLRGVAEPGVAPGRGIEAEAGRLFAASLLSWLWHAARRDRLLAALCIGPGSLAVDDLSGAGFRDLQRAAVVTPLEARFCRHPRLWPDLVRAAGSRDAGLLTATRLSIVQLTLVQRVQLPDTSPQRPARPWPRAR